MAERTASGRSAFADRDTLCGIAAMTASMAAFTLNDTCIKLLGERLPTGEVITIRNSIATVLLLAVAYAQNALHAPPLAERPRTALRVAMDVLATWCMVMAVIVLPIADATAISQFAPLAITVAAALYLNERVGMARWIAVVIGFIGVLLIVRPGTAGFSMAGLLPLAAVAFITVRDLATRIIGGHVPALMIAALSTAAGAVSGLAGTAFETWHMPDTREMLLGLGSGVTIAIAYVLIIIGMRFGDVATVSPFRYTVIAFSMIPGWLIWQQSPDAVQWLGIGLLAASGIYALSRPRG